MTELVRRKPRRLPLGDALQRIDGHVMSCCAGIAALAVMAAVDISPIGSAMTMPTGDTRADTSARIAPGTVAGAPEWTFGGYGGITRTLPSVVRIAKPGQTDLTIRGFRWRGRAFKAPIYYGLRSQRWSGFAPFGAMVDFTHAKAIAQKGDTASFSGTLDGKPVAPKAKIGEFFRHLEFSHGHNMLTLNGLVRLAPWWARIRPYAGAGAGISLPHTEVGIRTQKKRTYEYQFAGFVGQLLAGVEIQLGRTALFVEYKFTYAPYDVPLSHEPYGWLLVTDLWRQFSAWWRGKEPPGGRLRTTLITHHGIAGVLVKNRSYMDRITRR
jgi:lipid A oxidase